ncbi:MAG: hypothetical protein ACI93R_003710 [Flavobacteriales bacterium]|jgi:hypothetical protein
MYKIYFSLTVLLSSFLPAEDIRVYIFGAKYNRVFTDYSEYVYARVDFVLSLIFSLLIIIAFAVRTDLSCRLPSSSSGKTLIFCGAVIFVITQLNNLFYSITNVIPLMKYFIGNNFALIFVAKIVMLIGAIELLMDLKHKN